MPHLKSLVNGNFSHGGSEYRKVNGFVEVPHHVVSAALDHGYEVASAEEVDAILNPPPDLPTPELKTTKRPRLVKPPVEVEGTEQ